MLNPGDEEFVGKWEKTRKGGTGIIVMAVLVVALQIFMGILRLNWFDQYSDALKHGKYLDSIVVQILLWIMFGTFVIVARLRMLRLLDIIRRLRDKDENA